MASLLPDTWGWREVKLFIRFFIYSVSSLAAVVGLWSSLDLPQVASKDFVTKTIEFRYKDIDDKFKIASEESRQVKSQLTATRIQLNRINRQNLEAEKYRLTVEQKTKDSFETQTRIREITEAIEETADERRRLLNPGN